MSFKKILAISVFSYGMAFCDQVYKTTWFSGVAELDVIESSKYQQFCCELGDVCKKVFDEKFCENMKPCLTKWSKKYENHALSCESDDKNSKKNKKHSLKQISKKMQQDKELTLLVKSLAEVFDSYFDECVDAQDCAQQQLLKIMAQYFPETVDLNQVHLDYIVWSYEYLEKRLYKKEILKVDDISYVLKQFVYYMKQHIPFSTLLSLKKSYEMWMSLVGALEKGLHDQPKDVSRYFLEKVERFIKNPEMKSCFDMIKSMSNVRQDVIKHASKNKNKSVDALKIKEYEQLLDSTINQLSKVIGKHVGNKKTETKFFTMTEKLLFVV